MSKCDKCEGKKFRSRHTDIGENFEGVSVHDKEDDHHIIIMKDVDDRKGLHINIRDHLDIWIKGRVHDEPVIEIESNEYPTEIDVKDVENTIL